MYISGSGTKYVTEKMFLDLSGLITNYQSHSKRVEEYYFLGMYLIQVFFVTLSMFEYHLLVDKSDVRYKDDDAYPLI